MNNTEFLKNMRNFERWYDPDEHPSHHRYLWEQKHGIIPKDHILRCRTENTLNVSSENWELITRGEHVKRNMNRKKATKSIKQSWKLRNDKMDYRLMARHENKWDLFRTFNNTVLREVREFQEKFYSNGFYRLTIFRRVDGSWMRVKNKS